MYCKDCGGALVGDGYTMVWHCEFLEEIPEVEPDSEPVYCGFVDQDFEVATDADI